MLSRKDWRWCSVSKLESWGTIYKSLISLRDNIGAWIKKENYKQRGVRMDHKANINSGKNKWQRTWLEHLFLSSSLPGLGSL